MNCYYYHSDFAKCDNHSVKPFAAVDACSETKWIRYYCAECKSWFESWMPEVKLIEVSVEEHLTYEVMNS
jgi:hypothetical protein